MSDHYRTLGLQLNASKREIKNAYFHLAHSYHPDHHAKADAAGRVAAGVWFRWAKDAYEVLYDDRRRAEYDYDRIIRHSSSSSGGGYGNRQHGPYGGGGSSGLSARGTSYSTESDSEWIWKRTRTRGNGGGTYSSSSGHGNRSRQYIGSSVARLSGLPTLESEAAWKKMEEKIAKWEAQEAAEKAEWEAQKEKWNSQKEKREAEWKVQKAKWKAENEKREAQKEKQEAEWKVQNAKWKAENEKWEAQKEKQEAVWEEQKAEREKRQYHDGGPSSSLSGEDTSSSSMESDYSASAPGRENWQHGQKHGGECPWSDQRPCGFVKARGFHSRTISTREEWEADVKSLWRGDGGWESLWERVEQTRRDGGPTACVAEWESLREGVARGWTRRHSGAAYSSSGSYGNRQGQYSSWGHSGTSSFTASNGQGVFLLSFKWAWSWRSSKPATLTGTTADDRWNCARRVLCRGAWRICTALVNVQQTLCNEENNKGR